MSLKQHNRLTELEEELKEKVGTEIPEDISKVFSILKEAAVYPEPTIYDIMDEFKDEINEAIKNYHDLITGICQNNNQDTTSY